MTTKKFKGEDDPRSSPRICWFDVETTTGQEKEMIEIAIVTVNRHSLKIEDKYETLIFSDKVDEHSESINGISQRMLEGEPTFEEVAKEIKKRLHKQIWAGHNIKQFDSRVVEKMFMDAKKNPPRCLYMIDTLEITRAHFKDRAGSNSLADLMKYFDLGEEDHRAMSDTLNNIKVYEKMSVLLTTENSSCSTGFLSQFPPLVLKKRKTEKKIVPNPHAIVPSEKIFQVVADPSQEDQKKFTDFFMFKYSIPCLYIRYNNGSSARKLTNASISRDKKSFRAYDEKGQLKNFLVNKVLEFSDSPLDPEQDPRPKKKTRKKKE